MTPQFSQRSKGRLPSGVSGGSGARQPRQCSEGRGSGVEGWAFSIFDFRFSIGGEDWPEVGVV